MKRTLCVSCVLVTAIVFIIGGVLVVLYFQGLVDAFIKKEIPLTEGTQAFEWWKEPPLNPILKVYYFNVTNSKQFLEEGKKLKVQEVGPYSYRETWNKVNVSFNDNGTVSYRHLRSWVFARDLSVGPQSDIIIVPNVPMMTAVFQMQSASRLIKKAISTFLDIIKLTPFVNKTVEELNWGYEDPLLKLAKQVLPEGKKGFPHDKFGFFVGKNNTPGGVFTAFTGHDDINDFLEVESYDGKEHFDHWKTEECNDYKGTDGSGFPPFLTNESTIYIFQSDFCRSLPLVYEKKLEISGLQSYRFRPPPNLFDSVDKNPENDCYCPGGPPCTVSGVFNMSLCNFGAPVLLSWPHFYHGDQSLINGVEGLRPEKKKHEFFLDIQPKLGFPLRAKARIQVNVAMVKVSDIIQVKGFQNVILPILWFENGIEQIPDEILSLVKLAVLTPAVAQAAMTYVLFSLGIILLICVGIYLMKKRSKSKSQAIMTDPRYEMQKPTNGYSTDPTKKPQTIFANPTLVIDDDKAKENNGASDKN